MLTVLPGSDRKRTESLYRFRITYRTPDADLDGCVMTWNVEGGREDYQLALENLGDHAFRWHCTCPDAVYRSGLKPDHLCKHVRGLIDCLPPLAGRPDLRRSA